MDDQRRTFLKVAALSVAGTTLPACGSNDPTRPLCGSQAVGAGQAAQLAVGTALFLGANDIWVCRDEKGFYAMDACCTHLCCPVELDQGSQRFNCPCHGASYDFNGEDQTGPAPAPLPHYEVCVDPDGGGLLVDPTVKVAATVRYKP